MLIGFNEIAEYQLVHPITKQPLKDEKGKPMLAVIYSRQSSQYKNANSVIARKAKEKAIAGEESTPEEIEDGVLDMITSCVKEFKNLAIEYEPGKYLDPKDIKGTLQKAFWIKDQLNREIVNLANFSMAP